MRYLSFVSTFLVLMLVVFSMSCSDALADGNISGERTASSIADLSYKSAVDNCDFITFDSEKADITGFSSWWLNGMEGCIGKGVPDRPLTVSEKKRLGMWKLPNETKTFWLATLTKIQMFYIKHGQMPETGIDLFPELIAENGYSKLIAMDDDAVLNMYHEGIDPITGRFYNSFISKDWKAGAMNIEVMEDAAEIQEKYPKMKIAAASPDGVQEIKSPQKVWRIVIYGEEEGSILLDDIVVN